MDSPRKGPAIQEAFLCHGVMHTNNTSMIASKLLVYILHTYALKRFGTDFVNNNSKVTD